MAAILLMTCLRLLAVRVQAADEGLLLRLFSGHRLIPWTEVQEAFDVDEQLLAIRYLVDRPIVRPVPPEPTDLDLAVERLILEEVEPQRRCATVARSWSDRAGMWFTEAWPHNPRAAAISVAVQNEDTMSVTLGSIGFEMFGPPVRNLPRLRDIVAAVVAGAIEEAGPPTRAYGRVNTESGTLRLGNVRALGRNRWRKYEAYSDR